MYIARCSVYFREWLRATFCQRYVRRLGGDRCCPIEGIQARNRPQNWRVVRRRGEWHRGVPARAERRRRELSPVAENCFEQGGADGGKVGRLRKPRKTLHARRRQLPDEGHAPKSMR